MSSWRVIRSLAEIPTDSVSSSREGRRPYSAMKLLAVPCVMSRSQRRSDRGAQSWRRSSSRTAPWIRVHANCSSVAPFAGS